MTGSRRSRCPVSCTLDVLGEDLRPMMRAMVERGVRHAGRRTPPPASTAAAGDGP